MTVHVPIDAMPAAVVETVNNCACIMVRNMRNEIVGRAGFRDCPIHAPVDPRPRCGTCAKKFGARARVERSAVIRDLATGIYTLIAHCHGAHESHEIADADDIDETAIASLTLDMKHA